MYSACEQEVGSMSNVIDELVKKQAKLKFKYSVVYFVCIPKLLPFTLSLPLDLSDIVKSNFFIYLFISYMDICKVFFSPHLTTPSFTFIRNYKIIICQSQRKKYLDIKRFKKCNHLLQRIIMKYYF